jgi:exopolyphosphatase/guanosine-5'-triphosphate,3'-diphosphate pyrophosphatase
MRDFIVEELSRVRQKYLAFKPQAVLVTSGTAAALTSAASNGSGTRATNPQVQRLATRLAEMDVRERQALKGINAKRAEIIVAGAEVFARAMEILKLPSIRYLPLGLRDGLLAQMAAEEAEHSASRKQVQLEREDALIELATRYQADLRHAKHVRHLAVQLFSALKRLHQLPATYAEWIAAAAMLQEIGMYVNHTGRHRHAQYLISHSEIFGYTAQERNVIAAIARFQGKSKPTAEDRVVKLLPAGEYDHLPKAVMILRIARALNQGRNSAVKQVIVTISGERVALRLKTNRMRPELEIWAVEREVPYFREVFGRELLLSE